MKAVIAARQNSNDASSFMLGFKQVLRGVCDGDLVLHQDSCTIVEDACCLERLLKSPKKLSQSNFLDLFLDEESRDAQLKGFKFGCPAVDASYLLDLLSRNFLPSTAFKGLIRGRSSDLIRFAKVLP